MIRINLLDSPTQNRARPTGSGAAGQPLGTLVIVLTVALMLGVNGIVGGTLFQKVDRAGDEARHLRAEIKKVENQIAQHYETSDQVRQFQEVLGNQKEVLRTLDPPDRILWCEKINMLAALIPKDVFLSDIEVSEVVEMVETEQSRQAHQKWESTDKRQRGQEPETVKKPVIHYEIALTGLATGRDSVEQFDNVLAFHRAMTNYQVAAAPGKAHRFMDGFVSNVDFGSIEATTYEGAPVNKFVFKLRTLSQGEDNLKNDAKNVAATGSEERPARPTRSPSRENDRCSAKNRKWRCW
jgi:Tfp pilus assembly protein PilN